MESRRELDQSPVLMSVHQQAFFRQARSDWSVFRHLHTRGFLGLKQIRGAWPRMAGFWPFPFPACHELHYLQMCTEKLAKAYYPSAIPRSGHAAFRRFLTDLPSNPNAQSPLGFRDSASLTRWQGSVSSIVAAVEDLAPSIADRLGLPNPEYPWPRGAEASAPVDHSFQTEIFSLLERQARCGEPRFLKILGKMVASMQSGGWHL
jgi:hypothetical protein